MITEVLVVINDDSQKDRIAKAETKESPFFTFIDERSNKGLKEGRRFKGSFAARQTPFAVAYEENKVVKAFYSEAGDCIEQLIKFLNE